MGNIVLKLPGIDELTAFPVVNVTAKPTLAYYSFIYAILMTGGLEDSMSAAWAPRVRASANIRSVCFMGGKQAAWMRGVV